MVLIIPIQDKTMTLIVVLAQLMDIVLDRVHCQFCVL